MDIYLHHFASEYPNQVRDRVAFMQLALPCVPQLISWTPSKINASDQDLLQYFEHVGSNVLPMFDSGRSRVREILMRMALSGSTLASNAVCQAMLALASLYRDGLQPHAARLNLTALQSLMTSAKDGIDAEAGIQHIAAGILLACFEMQLNSNGHTWNCQWVGHICGAKGVVQAVKDGQHPPGSDSSIMLGWVYYYDVLARFSTRHWRTDVVSEVVPDPRFTTNGGNGDMPCVTQYALARASFAAVIPQISRHAHEVLGLLGEVCDTILHPWDPQYHSLEYQEYLDGLESRLTNVTLTGPAETTADEDLTPVLKLFRLAALIYLEHTSRNFSGQSTKLETWIDDAFSIFAGIGTCRHPFPLFIVGCEARTDDRRRVILDLISKTQQDPQVRSFKEVGALVQAVWVQDDLEVDGHVEYMRKVNLAISTFDAVPILV
ncbi:hypothetical protein A1O3_03137 [Capronia epimyces CBS 606.96]|uniref:Transcription factor domain-containing protein n=1 Tax=Capronia epimyces CBS 606.96 TaxID=1182542 RepID=W9Z6E7_9EURO|nr:uncharacterized protein A1O3_03137 [Capronia epimyces CBS 606.96]EXJ90069.1 hypothetical protein A1O3_03137 [Capronia epimyces CBS 606.96]